MGSLNGRLRSARVTLLSGTRRPASHFSFLSSRPNSNPNPDPEIVVASEFEIDELKGRHGRGRAAAARPVGPLRLSPPLPRGAARLPGRPLAIPQPRGGAVRRVLGSRGVPGRSGPPPLGEHRCLCFPRGGGRRPPRRSAGWADRSPVIHRWAFFRWGRRNEGGEERADLGGGVAGACEGGGESGDCSSLCW